MRELIFTAMYQKCYDGNVSYVEQCQASDFTGHCSLLYQEASGELYVPVSSAQFCLCNTWKCFSFHLVLFFLPSLVIN